MKVYHKPNGGVGSSRNRALEAVTGDYILFVDNDDWLELDHIESLYHLLKKADADIAIGNFTQFMEEEGNFLIHVGGNDYFERVYSPFEWFQHQYDGQYNLSQCFTVPWAKLYKAELFKEIVYPTDKTVEDDYTTYKVYLQADKIVYMNRAIYLHRKRETSVTKNGQSCRCLSVTKYRRTHDDSSIDRSSKGLNRCRNCCLQVAIGHS